MTGNRIGPFTALGQMIWLASFAENYRSFSVGRQISALTVPIELNQFRIYSSAEGRPLGFVTWALLSGEAERRLEAANNGVPTIIVPLEDWRSGDRIWFIDFVAPFGHARQMASDLRRHVFPGRSARALRLDNGGTPKKYGSWRNARDPLCHADDRPPLISLSVSPQAAL